MNARTCHLPGKLPAILGLLIIATGSGRALAQSKPAWNRSILGLELAPLEREEGDAEDLPVRRAFSLDAVEVAFSAADLLESLDLSAVLRVELADELVAETHLTIFAQPANDEGRCQEASVHLPGSSRWDCDTLSLKVPVGLTVVPGQVVRVELIPAAGSEEGVDENRRDDTFRQVIPTTIQQRRPTWNRSLGEIRLPVVPFGETRVEAEISVEAWVEIEDAGDPVDLSTQVDILVNGAAVVKEAQTILASPVPLGPALLSSSLLQESVCNASCFAYGEAGLYKMHVSPGQELDIPDLGLEIEIPGSTYPVDCGCGRFRLYVRTSIVVRPGDVVEVTLGPASGARPELPGLEADDHASLEIASEPPPPPRDSFRRGDHVQDGLIDLTDVIGMLGYLFNGEGRLFCADASDANDDGQFELTDAIALLDALFLGQYTVPAPGMIRCGADPTEDRLDCEVYHPCQPR